MKTSKIVATITNMGYSLEIRNDRVNLLGPGLVPKTIGFFYRTKGLKEAIKAAYRTVLIDKMEKSGFIYPAELYRKQKFNSEEFTMSVGDLKPFNQDLNITELYGASFEFEDFKGKVTDVEFTDDQGLTLTITRIS